MAHGVSFPVVILCLISFRLMFVFAQQPGPAAKSKIMSEEEVKAIRVDTVAKVLMKKMRLDPSDLDKPAGNRSLGDMKLPRLPRAVLDETREMNSLLQEKDDFYAKDLESIVAGEDMGRDCIGMRATGCYNFKFNGEVKGEVTLSTLWFYKTRDMRDITEHTFQIYELERPLRARNLIASEGTFIQEGWVTVNMTRPVRRWLEKRRDGKYMLAIRCKTCETDNHRAIFGAKHGYQPLLIIRYADKHVRRDKRSMASCNPETECCKRPLSIHFSDINMQTIYQPAILQAYYCYGSCDNIATYASNHTMVKQIYRSTNLITSEFRERLKPCCVPLQFKDTYILKLVNNNLVRRLLPNVIVETCGCL